MTDAAGRIPLLITLGHVGDNSFNLRFPPAYADEILSLLDEYCLDHNTGVEFSVGPPEWIEVVKVLAVGSGGLLGLAQVIKAFAHRHDGKRIILNRDGYEVSAQGYSEKAVLRFLQERQSEQEHSDLEIRKALGRTLDPDDSAHES